MVTEFRYVWDKYQECHELYKWTCCKYPGWISMKDMWISIRAFECPSGYERKPTIQVKCTKLPLTFKNAMMGHV